PYVVEELVTLGVEHRPGQVVEHRAVVGGDVPAGPGGRPRLVDGHADEVLLIWAADVERAAEAERAAAEAAAGPVDRGAAGGGVEGPPAGVRAARGDVQGRPGPEDGPAAARLGAAGPGHRAADRQVGRPGQRAAAEREGVIHLRSGRDAEGASGNRKGL